MLDLISCCDQAIMMHGRERLHYLRAFSLRLLRCGTEESEVAYRCFEHGRFLDTHGAPPLSYEKSKAAYLSRGIFLIYDLPDGEYEIDILWQNDEDAKITHFLSVVEEDTLGSNFKFAGPSNSSHPYFHLPFAVALVIRGSHALLRAARHYS